MVDLGCFSSASALFVWMKTVFCDRGNLEIFNIYNGTSKLSDIKEVISKEGTNVNPRVALTDLQCVLIAFPMIPRQVEPTMT